MTTPHQEKETIGEIVRNPPKRYDVYVSEPNYRMVVYSNVLFKTAIALLTPALEGSLPRFVEIEQPNGHIIYVPRSSIVKFCEHGVTLLHEVVSSRNEEKC